MRPSANSNKTACVASQRHLTPKLNEACLQMKIEIITPAPPRSRYGNRVTALRWGRILRELGHSVTLAQDYAGESCEVLIALHARRSYDAIKLFRRRHSEAPLIVALTGTDLYHDLTRSRQAQESLEYATRIVVLQPKGPEQL